MTRFTTYAPDPTQAMTGVDWALVVFLLGFVALMAGHWVLAVLDSVVVMRRRRGGRA